MFSPIYSLGTVADAPVVSAAYSPNGKLLAVGSENGSVIIFDSHVISFIHEVSNSHQTLDRVRVISDKTVKADDLSFSPQGDLLAIGYHDGSLDVHNTSDWKRSQSFKVLRI